ncbi:MAG TPA: mechanosensitive ion channel [Burkholderiaceae bacterium]|nr:mechanosensitive ion channel [Burkholderiaceae bacterium]HQR70322.1 mechanosensitive ion channel [Burkholderiaceae bacterium]
MLRTVVSALAATTLLAALTASSVQAAPAVQKLLGIGTAKSDKPASAPAPTLAEQRAQIEKELAAAQDAAAREQAGTYPVPAGATPAQVSELGWLLARIPLLLQGQLDVLQEIEAARAAREVSDETLRAWRGMELPGPYTLTQYDRALDQLDAERVRLHSYQSVGELQQGEMLRLETQLKASQAAERLAVEKAADGLAAPLDLARLRTRRTSEQLQLVRLQGQLNAELRAATQARIGLLEKQSAAIAGNYRFTEAELDRVLKGLQAEQGALDRRLEETVALRSKTTRERDQAQAALASLTAAKTVAEVRRQAELQVRVEAANATLEALRTEHGALTTLRSLTPLAIEAWRQRYAALSSPSADERQTAETALEASLARVDTLKSFAADLGNLAETAVQNQQRRFDALDEDAPGRRYEQAALDVTRQAASAVNEVQAFALKLATAQRRWKREYAEASKQRPAADRFADAWVETKSISRDVWNFELFAVEDTVEIGGNPVTLSRGVTIGKSIGALLIFLVGIKIAGFLATRAQRIMVQRFAVDEPQARVLRRWMMLLTGFVLLVVTLNLARIPLTVFAFMGGALAIGIGFGTQTLLRNFISGIIVLFERKVRVGDIVDVDGVQGVVTAVDVRSTTVRQFDGIETMVPNSLLLENKVTNWTGESPTMRRVVKVGVAYGSPTRKVAEIMKGAAEEHGQILKEPAPFVVFEDFGDNALVFALYFWVDLAKANGMQVMSDLRFMLEKRFAEAGVSIAFPQRDIHLDAARPLQVEVVGGRAAPGQAS